MIIVFVFISISITDSIIGIRSNYNANEQVVNPSINTSNLSTMAAATSNLIANNQVGNVTTISNPNVNQNKLVFDSTNREKSPLKQLETVNVHVVDAQIATLPVKSKVNQQPPTITVTPTDDSNSSKTIDGMLDRISHDLDYLLNRTSEIPPAPPPPSSTLPMHKNMSVHEVIIEEESEDI